VKTARYFAAYIKDYARPLSAVVVSMLLLTAVGLAAPWVVRSMIETVTDPEVGPQASDTIARLALMALALYVIQGGLRFVRSYLAHVAGWGMVADARRRIYHHLQRLSLRFYEDTQVGQLMSRMVNDSELFERLIAHAVPDVTVNVLTFVGVALVLAFLNSRLLLLSLIPVPFIVLAIQGFSRYVRPAFRERQRELGELNATINDNLSGIREIKAFTQEESEADRVSTHIDRYRDSMLRALRLMATFRPFVEFASSLGMVVLIYFGGRMVLGETLAFADLAAFFLYLNMLYEPVRVLSGSWEAIQEALAGVERVAELMEERPDVQDRPHARAMAGRSSGALRFRDVSFWYDEGTPVLEDIDLDIPAGTRVAVVGPTGVGKTTLASLIPRFYDVCRGALTLDGVDVRDLKIRSLRQQISIVLQDVFLFHGTARENILFGRPEASERQVIEAAAIANAHEFIARLPNGYDTLIGERGVKLSGGQKQRLAIARAVLRDAPILILDEATSSVDTETEMLIQQALDRLMQGRTTIIIAHRLSTIRNADMIVVLEGSRIREIGSHLELMAGDGLYSHLVRVQDMVTV
jgi:ATP-binding cassette subfamily B protein/subfamily B ATP-binding cassette protein MsbA